MLNANTYVTAQEGIGGTIRNQYEDFYVEEIPEVIPEGEGPNVYVWIEKLGRTTLDVVLDIARDLHISRKRMGFAGMKDKKAITRQWICIANMDSEEQLRQVENLDIYKTDFLKVVRGRKKLRMGQLKGNKFRILIKDLDDIEKSADVANDVLKELEVTGVPNYFGWQRFGKPRTITHLVGEALVENDLEKAVNTYIGNPQSDEGEENQRARQAYDDGNFEESLELMGKSMRYEKMMVKELIRDSKRGELTDKSYMNALHALPKPLQRMFVHAYQSYLFNEAVSKRVDMGINRYVEGDIVIDSEEHIVRDKSPEEIQELIDNFGNKFGLTITDEDDYYLNARYLNNVPLEQVWNNTENNPMLEVDTILGSLEDQLWNDNEEVEDDITREDQETVTGKPSRIEAKTE